MILNSRQTRVLRWCADDYDDSRLLRWLKSRLFEIAFRYCERRIPVLT